MAEASQVAVLASWLINAYLMWLREDWVLSSPSLVAFNQAMCSVACGLVNGAGRTQALGEKEPLLKVFFDDVFYPAFPDDFKWPVVKPQGNVFHALAQEMATNYTNYMDIGLHAHAIAFIQAEGPCNKETARALWNAVPPEDDAENPTSALTALVADMNARYKQSPFLFHRWLLEQVERTHRLSNALPEYQQTGRLFVLFPQRNLRTHFTAFDTEIFKPWVKQLWSEGLPTGLAVDMLVEALFPPRAGGWRPGRQIKTDGVRVSLTYVKEVAVPDAVGGATVNEARKNDNIRKKKLGFKSGAHSSFDPIDPRRGSR